MATLTLAIYGGGYASRGFIIKLIEYDSSNIHKLHAVAINFIREIIVFFHTLFAWEPNIHWRTLFSYTINSG